MFRPPRLPPLDIHTRLALSNWSFGLACLLDLLRRPSRPHAILTRDPRLAWMFLRTRAIHARPVLYEVHEIFSMRPRDNWSLDPRELRGVAQRTRTLEASVFREADLLLTLTRCCAELLNQELGVLDSRLVVVPDATTAATGALPEREDSRREVVYAGQLYPWKGVDVLIEAMTHLPDARLTVIGGLTEAGGRARDLDTHRAHARRLRLEQRVTFTRFVPLPRIRAMLSRASVGVVPLPDRLMSRLFTSPLKLFDYMAAGVPVVASDLPAIREVIADGVNGILVPPGDPEALAQGIRRLLDDPALAERLRRRALEDVAAFTWDRRAARIIEAVAPILQSGQRAAGPLGGTPTLELTAGR